jgi:hypothetical protein
MSFLNFNAERRLIRRRIRQYQANFEWIYAKIA